jgi:hypothetical protein
MRNKGRRITLPEGRSTSRKREKKEEKRKDSRRAHLDTLVDEQRGITTIVDNHVRTLAIGPEQGLVGAPPILI